MTSERDDEAERERQLDEAVVAYLEALERGERPKPDEWLGRFPAISEEFREFLKDHEEAERLIQGPGASPKTQAPSPASAQFLLPGEDEPGPERLQVDPGAITRPFPDEREHHALELPPGSVVDGYEIIRTIAAGGMGVVFEAQQRLAPHHVALKMIRAGDGASAEEVRRFRSEVEAAGRLQHPYIVPIYSVGEHRGLPYFTMKLMEGALTARVARLKEDPREAVRMMVAIARAIGFAHRRAVLHLDLKPGNILMDALNRPHVADFGLARFVEGQTFDPDRTEVIGGTLRYMAPEQAEVRASEITTSTDIYGLGAVLYQLLTGQPPAEGQSRSEIRANVIEGRRPRPRTLNPRVDVDLEAVCEKCLELAPSDRYETARELELDLVRWLRREPVRARPVAWIGRVRYWTRRHPAIAALAVVALVAGTGGVIGVSVHRRWAIQAEVRSLLTADLKAAPAIIRELRPFRKEVLPDLRRWSIDEANSAESRLRAALGVLALDPDDSSSVPFLLDQLGSADPAATRVLREEVAVHRPVLAASLWGPATDPSLAGSRRLRYACVLAALDPGAASWETIGEDIATFLVNEGPVDVPAWSDLLHPARMHLVAPLATIEWAEREAAGTSPRGLAAGTSPRGLAAAIALARLAADQPDLLLQTLLETRPVCFPVIARVLSGDPEFVSEQLREALARALPDNAASAEREALAEKQARLAAVAVLSGRGEQAWPLLRHDRDPRRRSALIALLPVSGLSSEDLAERATRPGPMETSERFALLLALGDCRPTSFAPARYAQTVERLGAFYQKDPDAGIHAASGWVLRQWAHQDWLDETDAAARGLPQGDRSWFVDSLGQTMVVLRPPRSGPRASRVGRDFAIANEELTVAQVRVFDPDYAPSEQLTRSADSPATSLTLRQIVAFCRWLTTREGMTEADQSYPDPNTIAWGDPQTRLTCDLNRPGYRLPTEAEWEYAARAGTTTNRYYGESEALLPRYAWFLGPQEVVLHPVGLLRPNDFGLFDVLGNAAEACFSNHQGDLDLDEGTLALASFATARGGSVLSVLKGDPTTNRKIWNAMAPGTVNDIGLRLVRTVEGTRDAPSDCPVRPEE